MHRNWLDELFEFFLRNLTLILTLSIGAVIKALVDLKIRQLKWYERLVNVILSVCVGWVSWKYLIAADKQEWCGVVVPLATLFGETVVMWLMTKSTVIFDRLLEKYLPKKK